MTRGGVSFGRARQGRLLEAAVAVASGSVGREGRGGGGNAERDGTLLNRS